MNGLEVKCRDRVYLITLRPLAILLDDGLFRGVPSWGRCTDYKIPDKQDTQINWPEGVEVHRAVRWLLSPGGGVYVAETVGFERDVIRLLDKAKVHTGLKLWAEQFQEEFDNFLKMLKNGSEKAIDLTEYGNKVVQLALFGSVKYA